MRAAPASRRLRAHAASFPGTAAVRSRGDLGDPDLQLNLEVVRAHPLGDPCAFRGNWDSPSRQETVGAHLIALRGWAAIAEDLPPAVETDGNITRRAWRIIDELLFALLQGSDPAGSKLSALWAELLDLCAPAAADVLAHLKAARMREHNPDEPGMYERLLAACPDQVRQLIEWAIRNADRLVDTFTNGPAQDRLADLVEDLAVIGTNDTATLLQSYVSDTEIGRAAVTEIRTIKRRIPRS